MRTIGPFLDGRPVCVCGTPLKNLVKAPTFSSGLHAAESNTIRAQPRKTILPAGHCYTAYLRVLVFLGQTVKRVEQEG